MNLDFFVILPLENKVLLVSGLGVGVVIIGFFIKIFLKKRKTTNKQTQKSRNNCTNIQIGGDFINGKD